MGELKNFTIKFILKIQHIFLYPYKYFTSAHLNPNYNQDIPTLRSP